MSFLHKFKLRDVNGPCVLHGSSMNKAKRYKFSIDQSEISLRFPRHQSSFPKDSISPKRHYQLEGAYLNNFISGEKDWGYLPLAFKEWDYYGPLFSGSLASLTMTLSIMEPRNLSKSVSLFHPRSFEFTVGNLLKYQYGDHFLIDGKPTWACPVSWMTVTKYDSICARFDVLHNAGMHSAYHYMVMPMTENALLTLQFPIHWSALCDDKGNAYPNQRDWLDRTAINELINGIIDSLEVKLSDTAQVQQQKALEGLEDTSLTSHYPPIDFSAADNMKMNKRVTSNE